MPNGEQSEVTRLLLSWSSGDASALNDLLPLVYTELRRLAAAHLRREHGAQTLRTTELVHEAYLRLVGQREIDCPTRARFFGIAANLIRQVLVNHARRRRAAKRGGGRGWVTLHENSEIGAEPRTDILIIDDALQKLEELDARQGRIVELRFFGGLTEAEIAGVLGISETTVKREWRFARALLSHELQQSRTA
jgi:RNA polymerase sigma factor (TIGR02999 family)